MNRFSRTLLAALALISCSTSAHFQELIPSSSLVTDQGPAELELALTFTHPMERGPAMAMGQPVQFGVLGPAGHQDLRDRLVPHQVDGQPNYLARYRVTRPGDYLFYVEPAPYWEPGEGKMIVHYTKVVVDAYGYQEGWDADVGFPVEIEPLVRPFGLWTGNLFQGIVKQDGQPVPFAEVEVEWKNDGSVEAPADAFVTQVIRADANGLFSYAMPRGGWWGFAALLESETPMTNPEGDKVPVELGALIWVNARDMK
ncbi:MULTISPECIES: DUF4198 domain-containing protein [Ferrimonas]|uniref:DUF4198 domain-containing protein n=1 Tax=Ferrimonas TaxID=44011 RepID=UPI0003FA4B99|nr:MULTISPECIES: DUF4198 domain-containing protein [Ferrimonas]USD38023.1 DUF4198 domain-containing protein [Ferrimonas sp. SCSIO 43195]